jgi:hypothetical protein
MCHTCQEAGAAQPLPDQARAAAAHPLSRRVILQTLAVAAGTLATGQAVQAKPVKLPAPGPRDTCPVCGMFVAPYPFWVATVLWRDGKAVHFDGAKRLLQIPAGFEEIRTRAGACRSQRHGGHRLLRHRAHLMPRRRITSSARMCWGQWATNWCRTTPRPRPKSS